MKKIVILVTSCLNCKKITNHLIGKEHTPTHRKTVGVMVMLVGVVIANMDIVYIHLICETIGNGVQAIGIMPFLDTLEGEV